MKNKIQSVRGTREFYPQQMLIRRWLYQHMEEVSTSFGYEEYDGPFIEKIDLYAAKTGEELVKEQSFVFTDRGGELVTLRPELTLSLARMVAARQNELVFPLRWWSFGPFWRYEKPQKGRTREFFQWNIDLIGSDSAEADAELVAICASFLKKMDITPEQIAIKVNHRKLMEEQLEKINIQKEYLKEVFHLIDRYDKLPTESWKALCQERGLATEQVDQLWRLINNHELWKESPYLTSVFEILKVIGVSDYVRYDARIIRGLDYYTGMVFEAWDVGGDGRAVLGGGHYDNLVADVGGSPLPGVGFAMGDVMFTVLLEKYGKIPQFNQFENTLLVTIFNQDTALASADMAARLRDEQLKVVTFPAVEKLQKQFKYADRMGISLVLVVGPDEIKDRLVTIKDLKQHTQVSIPQKDAVSTIKRLLAAQ